MYTDFYKRYYSRYNTEVYTEYNYRYYIDYYKNYLIDHSRVIEAVYFNDKLRFSKHALIHFFFNISKLNFF